MKKILFVWVLVMLAALPAMAGGGDGGGGPQDGHGPRRAEDAGPMGGDGGGPKGAHVDE